MSALVYFQKDIWLEKKLPWASRAIWVIFEVNAVMVLFVDVVLWGLIFPAVASANVGSWFTFHSLCGHVLNFVLVYIDFSLNLMSFEWAHFVFPLLWAALYILFQWIYFAASAT